MRGLELKSYKGFGCPIIASYTEQRTEGALVEAKGVGQDLIHLD